MNIYTFVVFTLCLLQHAVNGDSKLLFLHILFRHGDRAPDYLYPTDPNPESSWPAGLGHLTKLGMRQHFTLGNYLRSMYQDFITSNPNEVIVNSTNYDRTMRSAMVHLAGLYRPTDEWSFYRNIPWQPIPVHHKPTKDDLVLNMQSYCPRASQVINGPDLDPDFTQKHEEFFNYLSNMSGINPNDWDSLLAMEDTIYVEKRYYMEIPRWAKNHFETISNLVAEILYINTRPYIIRRLRAGPLINEIIQNMQKKINGEMPDRKVQIYSFHDGNMVLLMTALDVFNMKRPPYASTILIELHEMPDGEHTVRMLYQNSTDVSRYIEPPHALILPGCTEFCPIDFFIDYTKDIIPEDINEECQLSYSTSEAK